MKGKKLRLAISGALACVTLSLGLTGCFYAGTNTPVSIVSVAKTSSDGLIDTYTIYYSDGGTSTFQIANGADGTDGEDGKDGTNGKDGKDGDGVAATDNSVVINQCLQTVGKVFCEFTELDDSTEDDETDTKTAVYTGACVIYRMDEEYTYFLTNYHVIYDTDAVEEKISTTIHCYLYGSESVPKKQTDENKKTYYTYDDYAIPCDYVGGAAQYDIALVRAETSVVKSINENAKAVTFAEEYYVGQTAIAIGNPHGGGISVTEGIVSVDNDRISLNIDGTTRSYRSIRIDTALYPGNSGGGLFNNDGELIGITNAGDTEDQNINYAVPVQIVKAVAQNVLIHNGVRKLTFGVTVTSKNSKYVYDEESGYGRIEEDIAISAVEGIAAEMGLKVGDILTAIEIDGAEYELERYFDIGDYALYLTEGVKFRFLYERGGTAGATSVYEVKDEDLKTIA